MFSREKRSEIMRSIRSKDTKAEILTFQYLRRKNIYFQKHYSKAPGKPDIALPRKRIAVFIDGDFWHGKTFDRLLNSRAEPETDYWVKKIKSNMLRDTEQNKLLEAMGWKYIRIWEKDIMRKASREKTLDRIVAFLREEI